MFQKYMKLKNQGQKKSHFLYKLRLAIPTYLSKRIAVPAKYLNFGDTARSLFSLKGYIYFFAEWARSGAGAGSAQTVPPALRPPIRFTMTTRRE